MFRSRTDALLVLVLRSSAAASGLIVLLITAFLIRESVPAFTEIGIGRFLGDASWHPAAIAGEPSFNMTPMIAGTLLVSAGAMLLAGPIGLGSALFCRYYAPQRVGAVYRKMLELLAGIPSVVFGFWGLVTIVPLITEIRPPGTSLLAGILILALMILPTVALLSDSTLQSVPKRYLDGAAALGLSRWATIRAVALPAARSGLWTALILGAGRALGETMAVLMVCGNVVQVPGSVFQPVRALTANIALEMAYAMNSHRSALFVSGLLLMALVAALVFTAGLLSKRNVYR